MDLKYYAERYKGKSQIQKKDWRSKKIRFHLKKNTKVLDIGCAWWWFYDKYSDAWIDYYWIDYNKYMVDFCVNEKKLNCLQCDVSKEKLPYNDNSFDFVYCSHVIEHLLSNEQIFLFSEISRVLKKWWVLILFTPTPYSWYFWDDPTHQRPSTHGSLEHLSKDFWLDIIESKYSNLRFFGQNLQKRLRLPPMRRFLWEVYLIAKKK